MFARLGVAHDDVRVRDLLVVEEVQRLADFEHHEDSEISTRLLIGRRDPASASRMQIQAGAVFTAR